MGGLVFVWTPFEALIILQPNMWQCIILSECCVKDGGAVVKVHVTRFRYLEDDLPISYNCWNVCSHSWYDSGTCLGIVGEGNCLVHLGCPSDAGLDNVHSQKFKDLRICMEIKFCQRVLRMIEIVSACWKSGLQLLLLLIFCCWHDAFASPVPWPLFSVCVDVTRVIQECLTCRHWFWCPHESWRSRFRRWLRNLVTPLVSAAFVSMVGPRKDHSWEILKEVNSGHVYQCCLVTLYRIDRDVRLLQLC